MDMFGKICRHHRKERLEITKIGKFESDLLKAKKDTAPQNSRNFTDVCMVGEGGGGTNLSPTIQTSINFRNFAELHLCSLVKTYHFQIRQLYYFWGALFRGVDRFSLNGPYKKLKKNREKVFFPQHIGPVLLLKTIFRHWNCFLSPVATDGEDGHGLRFEKIGPTF